MVLVSESDAARFPGVYCGVFVSKEWRYLPGSISGISEGWLMRFYGRELRARVCLSCAGVLDEPAIDEMLGRELCLTLCRRDGWVSDVVSSVLDPWAKGRLPGAILAYRAEATRYSHPLGGYLKQNALA